MKYYLFLIVVILFNGCAALKKRQDAPTVMTEVKLPTTLPGFEKGNWPANNWWAIFEDEQLSRLIEVAIQDNPDLKAAAARTRSAFAQAKKSRSSLFPHLGFEFADNYEHLSRDSLDRFPPSRVPALVNQIRLGLNFEYEIDLFGKNRDRYRAALGEAKAMQAEMSQSLLIITVSFVQAYFNFQANLLHLELSEEILSKRKSYVDLIEQRVWYGLSDQITLENARTHMLQAEETSVGLFKEVAISQNALKMLMGLSPETEVSFSMPEARFDRPFPLPENLPIDLVSRRPDLMAQIWEVEAASHLIGAAKAAFFPNINLTAFLGLESLSWGSLFSGHSYSGALTPALHLPIFKGGELTAGLQEAEANFDAAVYDYNALLLRAAKEVANGLKTVQAINHERELQVEKISHTAKSAGLTYARYENGLDDYLGVIDAELKTLDQKMEEVSINHDRHLAILHLVQSLGGGY